MFRFWEMPFCFFLSSHYFNKFSLDVRSGLFQFIWSIDSSFLSFAPFCNILKKTPKMHLLFFISNHLMYLRKSNRKCSLRKGILQYFVVFRSFNFSKELQITMFSSMIHRLWIMNFTKRFQSLKSYIRRSNQCLTEKNEEKKTL